MDSAAKINDKILGFEWLVDNRSRNQRATLEIYKIISDHRKKLERSRRHRAAAQMLLGVAFSLWRAVFLADIKQNKGALLVDVEQFLEELIQNNTIGYPQDRKNRDWTFRYYVQNARERLKSLNKSFSILGFHFQLPGESVGLTPQEWWLTHQIALDSAIIEFRALLDSRRPMTAAKSKSRAPVRRKQSSNSKRS